MCEIFKNKPSDIKTGYKVLALIEDKLYSSFTGELYTLGKVPLPPKYCKRLADWNDKLDCKELRDCLFYNSDYIGYSGAYLELRDATKFKPILYSWEFIDNLVIVKIVFSGKVFCGYYHGNTIIAGNYVKSIEILDNI